MKYDHLKERRLQIALETSHLWGHSVRTRMCQSEVTELSTEQHIQQEACLWEVKYGVVAIPMVCAALPTHPTKH